MRLERRATREYRTWTNDSRHWSRYRPRAADIVISTYPKCGTTWMQRIVGSLVFQTPEPMPFSSEISLWIDGRTTRRLDEVIATIEAQAHRRFLKAHLPSDGLPIFDEVRYLHVARDGRDALMSWHEHDAAWLPEMIGRLDANGLGDETIGKPYPPRLTDPAEQFHRWLTMGVTADQPDGCPNLSYFHCEATWWEARHRPNVLMVHYNDLKADLAGEVARIAEFLAIPLPDGLLPELVAAAGLRAMQRDGDALLPHQVKVFRDGHRSFLNKGTAGRWRGLFRDDDLALYQAKLEASVTPECAQWLERGGRVS
jgi:aryl sulfotransferase